MWLPDCIGQSCSRHERRRHSLLPGRTSTQPQQRLQSVLLLRLLLVQLLAGTPLLAGCRSAAAAAIADERSGSEGITGMDEVLQGGQVHIAVPLPVGPTDSGSATQQNVVPDEEGTTARLTPQQQRQLLPPRAYPTAAVAATTDATVAVIYAERVHALPDSNASHTGAPGEEAPATWPTPIDGRSRADNETPSGDDENDDDGASGQVAKSIEAAAAGPVQLLGPQKGEWQAAALAANSTGTTQRSSPGHETATDLLPPLIVTVGSELGATEPAENATIAVAQPPDQPSTVERSAATEQADVHKEDEAAAVSGDAPESAELVTRQAALTRSVQQLTTISWAEDENGGLVVQLTGGSTVPQQQASTLESAAAAVADYDDNDRRQQQPHDVAQSTVETASAERSDHPDEPNTNGLTLLSPKAPGDSSAATDNATASDDSAMSMKDGYDQERPSDYGYTALPAHSTHQPHFAKLPVATESAASDATAARARNKSVELSSLQGTAGEGSTTITNRDLPATQGNAYLLHYPSRVTDFNDVSQASIVTAAARNAQLLSDATVTASDTAQANSSDSSNSSSDCCSSSAALINAATEHSADAIARNASAATNAEAAGTSQPLNASVTAAIEMTQPPRATFSGILGAVPLDGTSAAMANETHTTPDTVGTANSSVGASGSSTPAQQLLLHLLRGELDSGRSAQQQLQDETTIQAQEHSTAIIAGLSSDSNAVQVPADCQNVTGCNGGSKHVLSDDDSDRATSTASLSPAIGYDVAPGDRVSMLPTGTSIHRLFAVIHTAAERYHNRSGASVTDRENQPDMAAGDDSQVTSASAKATGLSGSSSSTAATELMTTSAKPAAVPNYVTSTREAVSPAADHHHPHLSPPRGAAKLLASTPRPSVPQPLPQPTLTSRKSQRPPAASLTTASQPASGQLRSKALANDDRTDVASADESLQPHAQLGIQRLQAAVELRTTTKPSVAVASLPRAAAEDRASTASSSTNGAEGGGPADPGTVLDASEVGDGTSDNGSDGETTDAERGWTESSTVAGIAAGSAVAVCLVALGLAVWLVRRRSRRLRRHRRQRRHRGKGFGSMAASTGRRGGCRRHEEQDEREARYALHQTEHSLLEDLVMLELAKARSRGYVCDSDKVNYDEVFNLNAAISNQMITEL